MSRTCRTHGRNEYSILAGRSEGKRPLTRSRCIWQKSIKWI